MGGQQSSLTKVTSTPTFANRLGGRVAVYDSPRMSPAYMAQLRAGRIDDGDGEAVNARSMRRTFSDAGAATTSSSGEGSFAAAASESTPLAKGSIPARELEHIVPPPPPLSHWIGPALSCALCYALYNIFIKKGSSSIHPVLGGVILQFVAALLGCCLLAALLLFDASEEGKEIEGMTADDGDDSVLFYDGRGIRWSVAAGVAVGLAEMISFLVSGMGVQAMQSIPIIIGGSVMFGTVLGWMWLGETLSAQGWSGVLLLVLGIVLVGTDPAGGGGLGH